MVLESPPNTLSILARLKSETSVEHRRIEQSIDLPQVATCRKRYVALLESFYGFYGPFEEHLAQAGYLDEFTINLPERLKSQWLVTDLRVLGYDPSLSLPRCDDLPDMTNAASIWGSLYVLEGSTLGGQIISRILAKNLGLTAETGGRFFHGYGDRTGDMWSRFGTALTDFARDPSTHVRIIEAASQTFSKLRRWLEVRNGRS